MSPRIEGNFIFITYSTTNVEMKCIESDDPTEIMFKVFVSYLKPLVNGVDGPFIIYQSTIPHLSMNKFICSNTRMSMSSFCILVINSVKAKKKSKKHLLKISFQDSGLVLYLFSFLFSFFF